MDEIEVLSIEFFNTLLKLRAQCEERQNKNESYRDWYNKNFSRQNETIRNVEQHLVEAFKDKNQGRILDIWIEMPQTNDNSYINQHFEKMDKELRSMNRA